MDRSHHAFHRRDVNTVNTISTTREALGLLGGIGVVIIIVSLPLWLGLVRRNMFWGARTHTALASDENWRIINRAAGRVGTLWGVGFLALAGLVWLAVPDGLHKAVYNLLVAVPGISLVVHLVVATVRAERPLREPETVQRWSDGPMES